MHFAPLAAIGLLGLASSSRAQDSSSSSVAATSTASAAAANSTLIPTNISTGCSSYLNTLNNDPSIQACTAPLLSATFYYANATEAAKNANKTAGSVSSSATALQDSLGQLCANSTGCQPDMIRKQLSLFWNACSDEMKARNQGVVDVYDVLYLINPFHDAVCTMDDSQNYCVLSIANNTAAEQASGATRRSLDDEIVKRQNDDNATATAASIEDDTSSNVAYLFLQPKSGKSILCSSCSKNIMASYIQFETSIPYAIGLANSETLQGQSALYKAMEQTCGKSFTTDINEKAGTTAFAEVSGAMSLVAPGKIVVALSVASIIAVLLS